MRPRVIVLLMCLEVLLGVTTACLPVLKPVFKKVREWVKSFSHRRKTSKSSIFGSILILRQVSQMWQPRSRKRTRRADLDSMIEIEDWRRTQNCIQSTPRPVRAGRLKETEIHIQREVRVESA